MTAARSSRSRLRSSHTVSLPGWGWRWAGRRRPRSGPKGPWPQRSGCSTARWSSGSTPTSSSASARPVPTLARPGPRDLAACVASGELGATTVGGTLAAARLAGIRFMGTGGIGGVHRGFAERPDVSRRPGPARAHAGARRLLRDQVAARRARHRRAARDARRAGARLPHGRAAALLQRRRRPAGLGPRRRHRRRRRARREAHWELGGAALLLARDPDDGVDVEPLIQEALAAAATQGIYGQGVTPFVLSFLHERSDGRTLEVNRELIVANARLAAQVAVAATG